MSLWAERIDLVEFLTFYDNGIDGGFFGKIPQQLVEIFFFSVHRKIGQVAVWLAFHDAQKPLRIFIDAQKSNTLCSTSTPNYPRADFPCGQAHDAVATGGDDQGVF